MRPVRNDRSQEVCSGPVQRMSQMQTAMAAGASERTEKQGDRNKRRRLQAVRIQEMPSSLGISPSKSRKQRPQLDENACLVDPSHSRRTGKVRSSLCQLPSRSPLLTGRNKMKIGMTRFERATSASRMWRSTHWTTCERGQFRSGEQAGELSYIPKLPALKRSARCSFACGEQETQPAAAWGDFYLVRQTAARQSGRGSRC